MGLVSKMTCSLGLATAAMAAPRQLQAPGGQPSNPWGAISGNTDGANAWSNLRRCPHKTAAEVATAISAFGCNMQASDCSQRCADSYMPLYRECASILTTTEFVTFTAACEVALAPTSIDTTTPNTGFGQGAFGGGTTGRLPGGFNPRADCSAATTLPTILECSAWTANALADGVINADDNFCDSSCSASLAPIWTACNARMAEATQTQLGALAPLLSTCQQHAAAGQGATNAQRCDTSRASRACGGDMAAAAERCDPKCLTVLDTLATPCTAAREWAPFQPVIDACKQTHEHTICEATSTTFVSMLDSSCCTDLDCTDLPAVCTPECAATFAPFFSRCGMQVFGGSDELLTKFSDFNHLCAEATGRVDALPGGPGRPTHSNLRGPDPNDVCSTTTVCGDCSGKCGWCKDELTGRGANQILQRFGGGWCSSTCVTTDGECDAVTTDIPPFVGGGPRAGGNPAAVGR